METIKALTTEYDMLPRGGTVLHAVSGDADSMRLLHLLHTWAGEGDFRVVAAHYNHNLRGVEPDRDATFVAEWCVGQDTPCVIGTDDVAHEARVRGLGVEETAHQMRYEFLRGAADVMGRGHIAVAHSVDDNLETLLPHLVRGVGLRGLVGILPRWGVVVCPLLTTSRVETVVYLEANGVAHVEDSSSADEGYARNRIRRQVVPVLRQSNPRLTESAAGTMDYLRTDNDYLNAQAAAACQNARWAEDDLVIEARYIAQFPTVIAPRTVRHLLEMVGDDSINCSAAHLKAVVELARGDDPSVVVFLPGGRPTQRVYRELLFTTQSNPPPPFLPTPLALDGEIEVEGMPWWVRCHPVRCLDESEQKPGALYLAQGALEGPPAFRPRQTGDAVTLPKRGGTKTLKKSFIDEKAPRREWERTPVPADGRSVTAVVGFGSEQSRTAVSGQAVYELLFQKKGRGRGMEHMLDKDVERVFSSEGELHRRVAEIAAEIDRDYAGRESLLVSVLRGPFVFMADLVRQIHLPYTVDSTAMSPYGVGTASSGQVRIIRDPSEHIEGRDVIVVKDILDSGNTLNYLLQLLQVRSSASVQLCTLLDKPSRRIKGVELHYSGLTTPDHLVVGYGLDYAEKYRNLPYIGILKPCVYGGEE